MPACIDRRRLSLALAVLLVVGQAASAEAAEPEELWVQGAEPVLERHCFKCHGGVRQQGGLDLRSLENLLVGGDQSSAVEPGDPADSLIYLYIQPDADPHMPPGEGKQLAPEEIGAIADWIASLPNSAELLPDVPETDPDWPRKYAAALRGKHEPAWTPPADASLSQAIDGFIEHEWQRQGIQPAPGCDDRVFVRRVYLDLAGRIPTLTETEAFLQDGSPDRRTELVDRLLAGAEYARHFSDVFDVVFMERQGPGAEDRRQRQGWFAYLENAFRTNRPWNQVLQELIVARPETPADRGVVSFLYERKDNHQAMAEAIGPLAFGMRIQCAQCHNHPLAWEVEQRHYWGLVAALNRSKNVDAKAGPGVAESAIGGFVNFANLKKESQPALLTFLNGQTIDEKRPGADEKETDSPELYLIAPPKEKERPEQAAVPKFSRREELAKALTQDNRLLARAMANRFWALLMGRGLVHPVDQMDAKHRPSHPDLLDWLAADIERHGYDVKRLVRSLVLSQTYALDSRWSDGNPPPPESFARAVEKPLSAEQLCRSLLVATTGQAPNADGKFPGRNERPLRRTLAANMTDLFAEDYNASVSQGMFLSNSPLVDELLQPKPNNTAGRLAAVASPGARIEQAFLIVLGRLPDDEEKAALGAYLSSRTPEAGVKQMLWALAGSAEFLVNH
ncbi:MAG TPA: DUF1549 domain-containing protein [Pirellulales bacterium]|nr:DUF1549 domain-containing protein [Pirellulales bacterium]